MEGTLRIDDRPGQSSKRGGLSIKYKVIAITVVVVLVVGTSLVLFIFDPGRKNSSSKESSSSGNRKKRAFAKPADKTNQLSCDVAIVGGGVSGLYVAETLLRLHKETDVCLFERSDRVGGRIHDYTFQRMPGVPVSLGAWRVDETHSLAWKLLKRFGIPVSHLAKNLQTKFESRGIFATDRLSLKQRAFPALNQGRFQNSTFEQMIKYLFSHRREANNFASSYDFFSEYLTPEGFQLFSHIVAWLPDYNNQPQPRNYLARMVNNANFKRNFSRPDSGLSAITRALKTSATNLGARIYKKEEIKVIEENREKQFKLNTTKYRVKANKLVVAIPPQPMKQLKGSVAEKIQKDSIFQSVGLMLSFKGFAVFEEAWWQDNSTGSRYLADEQVMVSTSDCLGFIFPYKKRGPKGEAVLQISYATALCATKWGELLKISKKTVDEQILRALGRLFPEVKIPKPLESVYMYWEEGAFHIQSARTRFLSSQVRDWAKRPFAGKDLFIIGEAYHTLTGWIEGALLSAENALHEGWGIKYDSDLGHLRDPLTRQKYAFGDNFDLILY